MAHTCNWKKILSIQLEKRRKKSLYPRKITKVKWSISHPNGTYKIECDQKPSQNCPRFSNATWEIQKFHPRTLSTHKKFLNQRARMLVIQGNLFTRLCSKTANRSWKVKFLLHFIDEYLWYLHVVQLHQKSNALKTYLKNSFWRLWSIPKMVLNCYTVLMEINWGQT